MKKLLITILIIFSGLSVYGQTYETQGLAIGDPDVAGSNVAVFDSITEVGGFIHFYVGAVEMFALDTTNINLRLATLEALTQLDSIRESDGFLRFYGDGGTEYFAIDTTAIYAKIALMAADSFHISGTNLYAMKDSDTLIWKDPPSAIVDLDDISADIHAIFQNDSTTFTANNEVAFWEGSTQRYPDITGINYYMPAHWQLLGSDVKAIPLGSEMYVGGGLALADGEEFFMTYYLYDTTVITGARVTLSVQGDYTADNYNGIALYSNSTSGIVLIDSTLNGAGDIWKAAAGATVDSTFAAGPHTLAPGLYTVSVIYNQSAQTAAPVVVGRSTLITTTQRFAFANNRKLTGRATSRTAPADIVHSSITSYSYCVQVVLY